MGIRGRRPVPTALKLLRGNPGRRRLPQRQAKPTAGVACPKELSAAAVREWKRVAPEMRRLGILTQIDRAILAAYCEAWSDFRWAVAEIEAKGRVIESGNHVLMPHPAVAIKKNAMKQIQALGTEMGFSPSSRTRLHFVVPDTDDSDERFFGRPPTRPQGR